MLSVIQGRSIVTPFYANFGSGLGGIVAIGIPLIKNYM